MRALYYHRVPGRPQRRNQVIATRTGDIDHMVEKFIEELEGAIEAIVKSRLRDAAFGLPQSTIVATTPAVVSAGRVGEPTRARPGRCVGVITGGRRCGRAAPPGDPPLCSFCRATAALVNGATARVQITLTPPADPASARPERIQISATGPTIDPGLIAASRKERCKGVLLGGGSCRSRVMPPNELCPWCRALGVQSVREEQPVQPPANGTASTRV
jgi:hypothetical protein